MARISQMGKCPCPTCAAHHGQPVAPGTMPPYHEGCGCQAVEEGENPMAVLNAKQRKRSATIVVDGDAKFPMPDKAHARAALARLDQARPPLTAAQKAKVKARAYRILGPKPSDRK